MQTMRTFLIAIAAAFCVFLPPGKAMACPGCGPLGTTFSEEMATMDVAAICRLVKGPARMPEADEAGGELAKAKFEIVRVLKGERLVKTGYKFETLYFGDGKAGASFFVMGVNQPKIAWSTPLPVGEPAVEYLAALQTLPKEGPERLRFFLRYLEHADEHLARDAYDEFARAPYPQVKALEPHLDHKQVIAWVTDKEVPSVRRRLYWVMLGVCGSEADLPLLEERMRSSDREARAGLDMIISCYLTLKGEDGLRLIEELFLANEQADYADTYAAVVAIRFHANDFGELKREPLTRSLHTLLSRPELADLVIPDLAKAQDWTAIDKLFDLYKNADPKTSWVRVPVVNYLRACPDAKAKLLLKECERIDPAAVKRANSFFPTLPAIDGTAG
jgi:hypothetical protein